jgi:hypothetical protein
MGVVDSPMSGQIGAANASLDGESSLGPLSLVDHIEYAMRNKRKSAWENKEQLHTTLFTRRPASGRHTIWSTRVCCHSEFSY